VPSWSDVVELGLRLPEVEESTWYGTPALNDGSPYVLVRLDRVSPAQLGELIEDGWRIQAPVRVVAAYDAI
jgi:hypothetical protein